MSHELDIPDSRWDTAGAQAFVGALAAMANLIPEVGGVVSAVASGRLMDRKLARLAETVDYLRIDLGELRVDLDDAYVRSEDFEDLLEEALLKAARERSERKRRAYAHFVAHDLRRPTEHTHDEKLRVLRKLEVLQDDHLRLLAAIVKQPAVVDPGMLGGSRGHTLAGRMGEPVERVTALFTDLRQEDLVDRNAPLGGMMTSQGAEQTSQMLTSLGRQLVDYLEPDD